MYELINEMFNFAFQTGFIMIKDLHIHDESQDYAEMCSIRREDDGWSLHTGLSGGRQECVWNTYVDEFPTFMEALVSAIDINSIEELHNSYIVMIDFLQRNGKISLEKAFELDDNALEKMEQLMG